MVSVWRPLTTTLRLMLANVLECTLLVQGWRLSSIDEAAQWGLAARCALFWRQLRFSYAGRALLIGYTLAPSATLAAAPTLRRLGDWPVGELLFADPRTRRGQIQVARPRPGTVTGVPPAVAARRSVILPQQRWLMGAEHVLSPMLRLGLPPCS